VRCALKPVYLACALIFLGAAAQGEQISLTPQQLVITAGRALAARMPDAALDMAQALLQRDPNDVQALLIKARALRDMGQFDDASKAAKSAWSLAQSAPEKFGAAMVMAQISSSDGRRTVAQVWLRRATQHATTDRQRAQARRDFQYVRARNPWSLKLSFGAAPSSNINGGTNTDTITLFGLPFELSPDAQALSGYQVNASVDLSYRIAGNGQSETRAGLQAYAHANRLSPTAIALAPDARGADYNYASAAATLVHTRAAQIPGRKLTYSLNIGRNWYAGSPLSDFASTQAQLGMGLGGASHLTVRARADAQRNIAPGAGTLFLGALSGDLLRPTDSGAAFRLSFGAQKSFSSDATQQYTQAQVGLDYFFAKPILGTNLSMGISASQKDYAASYYTTNGRHDFQLSAHVEMRFGQVQYYGFSPVVTVKTAQTTSNVALYSTDSTSIALGFRSNF